MRAVVLGFSVMLVAVFQLSSSAKASDPCPANMKLVDGEYCPQIKSECLDWMDKPDAIVRRCKQYGPSICAVKTRSMSFCIDIHEFTEADLAAVRVIHPSVAKSLKQDGDLTSHLPLTKITYYQADEICKVRGGSLCAEEQWEMACEGPAYNNYPVGQTRRCDLCNCDRTENIGRDFDHRVDHRETIDEVAACVSGYGIEAMTGNADEWTRRTKTPGPYVSVLHGGHWLPIRARCTPDATTTGHGPEFNSLEVGFRCCASHKD